MQLDEVAPGFIRWLMQSSALRRHLFGLVAAEILEHGPHHVGVSMNAEEEPLAAAADALMSWPAQRIVGALLGSVPDGYIGALSKSENFVKSDGYRALHDLLTTGGPERIAVLKQTSSVQYGMISRLLQLNPLLCKAPFVGKLTGASQVEGANHVVQLAKQYAGADDARIEASAAEQEDIGQWAKRWFERMDTVPHHLRDLGDEFTVLASATQIKDAARRYRNCSKTRIPHIVLGREIIVEHEQHQVLAVLTALTEERYLLDSLWGPANERPSAHVAKEIVSKLRTAGILAQVGRLQPPVASSTLRLMGLWEDHRRYFEAGTGEDDESE